MTQLFSHAVRLFQNQARADFARSRIGQIVGEVNKLSKAGRVTQSTKRRLEGQLRRLGQRGVASQLMKTATGGVFTDIDRYAKGGKETILDSLFKALGPIGSIFRALMRPGGEALPSTDLDRELAAAANLLRAFGWEVKPPSPRADLGPEIDRSQAFLESLGFRVEPPPGFEPAAPPSRRKPIPLAEPEQKVNVGGVTYRWDDDDPILTGEMIDVTSSNVHSIGYLFNRDNPIQGTLQVRFLQSRGSGDSKSKGPGPLYYYYNVHPSVFEAFQRAASKGEFVWDRLRIRGTVSGHRYQYKLTGIVGGYVPREATRYGSNEYFIRRRVRGRSETTGELREFTSELPDRFVQIAERQPAYFGVPRRGEPNRGAPNRGR